MRKLTFEEIKSITHGVVISDWRAVHDICRSLRAGLDLQMPRNPHITEELGNGIKNSQISMSDIDRAVDRMPDL